MISLNLLPPEEKKQVSTQKYYLFIKNELIFLLIISLLLIIISFSSRIILTKHLIQANEEISLVNPIQMKSRQEIMSYNNKLQELKKIQKEFIPWSNIIWKIFNEIPTGITIDSLVLKQESGNMIIEGLAVTRQDLLNLEKNIKNDPFFISYHLPLKDKLQKKNIHFTITAQFSLEKNNIYENQ